MNPFQEQKRGAGSCIIAAFELVSKGRGRKQNRFIFEISIDQIRQVNEIRLVIMLSEEVENKYWLHANVDC